MKKIRWSRLSLISIVLLFSTLTSEIHHTVLKDENTQLNELRKKLQNHVKLSDINEGTLVRKIDDTGSYEILPNLNTLVNINIDGMVSTTTVDQVFTNTSADPIEAIYVFPLPTNAAVNDMKMIINDRFIQGKIQEKQEARETYEKAKKEGKRASLTEQNRPNIFTNTVANIMPGDTLIVRLQFVDKLHYEKGKFRLNFPLVVAPRYIPGREVTGYTGNGWSFDTEKVPDASKITPPVLPPGMRSGNTVSINITLKPGLNIRNIHSNSHEILITNAIADTYQIKLKNKDEIPNRDFILEYTAAKDNEPTAALFTTELDGEDYFMLMAVPPIQKNTQNIIPRNITFVIDVSGSMDGQAMEQAKSGFEFALDKLHPEDSFNIIPFSNHFNLFSSTPLSANVVNIEIGKNYVRNLNADGGTEALGALIAAMGMQQPDYLNLIIFLTDGGVGNESRIISTINRHLGKSRLFSVGIGSAPNRHLLEQVSRHGKGSFTYISSPSEVNEKMGNLIAKIDNPVITDLKLNILAQSELFPDPLPDLFINEPVVVFGKLRENYGQTGILTGRVNDKLISLDIPIFQLGGIESSGIPYLWARKKIDNLTTRHRLGDKEAKPEIIDLAIQYNLMSKFTSFVAVEHKIVNPKGEMLSSVFPTDLAKGLNFDKFFSKNTSIQLAELPQTATQYPLYVLIGLIFISLSLLLNIRYAFAKV